MSGIASVFIFVMYPVPLMKMWFLQFYIIVSQEVERLA